MKISVKKGVFLCIVFSLVACVTYHNYNSTLSVVELKSGKLITRVFRYDDGYKRAIESGQGNVVLSIGIDYYSKKELPENIILSADSITLKFPISATQTIMSMSNCTTIVYGGSSRLLLKSIQVPVQDHRRFLINLTFVALRKSDSLLLENKRLSGEIYYSREKTIYIGK